MSDYKALAKVKGFQSLIEYLRNELDWEFQTDDIDDLTFDYDPEKELGLDESTAAKIVSVKQIRPLTKDQAWGIFYIDFEKKKLPVVALRRILSKLVLKRRASGNKSDRAAWEMHDLLFISSCGENLDRTMTIAHFSDNKDFGDLPILHVLYWNDKDTVAHMRHAHETLTEKLSFPDDPDDLKKWREQWTSAFAERHGEVVRTSKQLAVRLAELAANIRTRANEILHLETKTGDLRKLHKAFQEALIHDLTYDDFADMYAQTISYGLLTAKISRPSGLVADNIADMIPVTNPFLKELLQTFLVVGGRGKLIDFDELGINDVVEMLRNADMEAVLRDFGDRNPTEDPAIHFYELFLKEYDPKKRLQRGVFYTPRPVVSFIVRSVHEILQKEFGLADGLADTTSWGEMKKRNRDLEIPEGVEETAPFVQILDPATGTGTFLVEVINTIYVTLQSKWQSQGKSKAEQTEAWNDYVPKNLLPRLFGFELMMAPYSIAHMKIGLKLSETGYRFLSSERAQIYLTNTLEEPKDFSDYFTTMSPALAHEAESANKVKRNAPITVVIGNPPYSKISSNLSDEARAIVEKYRYVGEEKIKERGALQFEINIQDDYVKFFRWCESRLEKVGTYVLGLITNNGFLSTPTLRGMRFSLLETFPNISVINLFGHAANSFVLPNGDRDENVFEIQQGVSISIFRQFSTKKNNLAIQSTDVIGKQDDKYTWLNNHSYNSIEFNNVNCSPPFYRFISEDKSALSEINLMVGLQSVLLKNSAGIITARDALVIDFNRNVLLSRMEKFSNDVRDEEEIYESYRISGGKRFDLRKAQKELCKEKDLSSFLRPVLHRPFDCRTIFHHPSVIWSMARPVANELINSNLALIATRQFTRPTFEHIFVSRSIIEIKACSHDRNTQIFPLYLYPTEKEKAFGLTERAPNFSDEFIKEFSDKLGIDFTPDGENANDIEQDADNFTPEDIFHYAYAVFHSPAYRARYAEFLKIDFPRLPLTTVRELFRKLCGLGSDLVALHLLEPSYEATSWETENKMFPTENHRFKFKGSDDVVATGHPKYETENERVYINKTSYFAGIPETVWNFHIGGYQVCHKWLKDRKGRALSLDDQLHYNKIAIALGETIRLMAEIDEVIEAHGGFPLSGSGPVQNS